jgi:predicted nucleic-acid-binding protein
MALDTNILVRFLIKDDEKQAQLVYQLFKQTEDKDVLFVLLFSGIRNNLDVATRL